MSEPKKIVRFLSTGNLFEDHADEGSLLSEVSRIMDDSYTWDILGEIIFEGEDGRFYAVEMEASIGWIPASSVRVRLGLAEDASLDDPEITEEKNQS